MDRSLTNIERVCVFEMRENSAAIGYHVFLTWGDLINYWTSKFQFFIVLERFYCSYVVNVSSVFSKN